MSGSFLRSRLAVGLVLTVASGCSSGKRSAAIAAPVSFGRPVVVLAAYGPFNVTGFDGPAFVLYSSGAALFYQGDTASSMFTPPRYKLAHLTPFERDSVLGRVVGAMRSLDSLYVPRPHGSDPVVYEFKYFGDRESKQVRVIGGLWPSAAYRDSLPSTLVDTYDYLTTFRHPWAVDWMPDSFQVLLWRADVSDCEPLEIMKWPGKWSGPIQSLREDVYSLTLPSSEFKPFVRLQAERANDLCRPVQIAGRTWSLGYRFPFPAEKTWMPY